MTGGEWPDARERQMTAKVETRAAAPSLSLRLLQGEGGDFDFLKDHHRNRASSALPRMPPRTNPKLRPNLPRNPPSKILRSPIIHRHHNNPPQRTSKKHRNPLRAILPPKHHPLALANPARLQLTGEPNRQLQHLPVSEPLHPVSTPLPVSALIAVRLKVR
jgi:hypothetical protein